MTPKERLLCALDGGKPDRMPVPRLDVKPIEALYDEIGDSGILRGFVWGDQFNVVTGGPRELIDQTVHKRFETVGAGGGYICSLSDHFFETPPRKLPWYADAARACVY